MINLELFKTKMIDFFKDKDHILESYLLIFLMSYLTIGTNLALRESSQMVFVLIPCILLLLIRYSWLCYSHLSAKFLAYFPLVYLIYLVGSYFMTATFSLADETFVFTSFEGLLQYNFIPHLLVIGITSFGFNHYLSKSSTLPQKALTRTNKQNSKLESSDAKAIILSQVLVALMMTGTVMIDRFLANSLFPATNKPLIEVLYGLLFYSFTFFTLFSGLTLSFIQSLRKLRKNQASYSLSLVSSVLFATIFNYFIQKGIAEYWTWYRSYIVSGATIFQISFLTALFMLGYSFINRYLVATVVNLLLGITLVQVNAIKFELRSEPLLIGDFVWLKDIQFFTAYISKDMVIIGFLCLLSLIFFLLFARRRILPGAVMSFKHRLWTTIMIVLMATTSFVAVSAVDNKEIPANIPVLSSLYNKFSKPWLGVNASAKYQSLAFVWLKQLTAKTMMQPEGYSEEAIDRLYKKYRSRAEVINETRTRDLNEQTVIYVLSESSSDPARIGGITLSQDVLPNIREIQTVNTSGIMKADGYGGGTANMEFQSLTGLPMYNFNEMISILYTEVVPKMSTIPAISDSFAEENRIAIHLNNASNYSRSAIYQKLKYSTFVATSGGTQEPVDTTQFGNNYSDEATYNNVLALLDENASQFFSVMTIQNHSPWGMTDSSDITAQGDGFTEEQNQTLTNFSRLLFETDRATQDFLDKLSELDKDITVVFYGDHLPAAYPSDYLTNQGDLKYQTDFFIWSNHEENQVENIDLINSSDFPALLLEHTNSKVSAYYALLTEVLHQASVNQTNLSEEQEDIANDLKMLQYDLTQGKKYISKYSDFFE